MYLKDVAQELDEEEPCTSFACTLAEPSVQTHFELPAMAATSRPRPLRIDLADRLLLARLSLSPSNMNDDDFEMATVLASLPANETAFEYLGGCWRRERAERFKVVAKKVTRPPRHRRLVRADTDAISLIAKGLGCSGSSETSCRPG